MLNTIPEAVLAALPKRVVLPRKKWGQHVFHNDITGCMCAVGAMFHEAGVSLYDLHCISHSGLIGLLGLDDSTHELDAHLKLISSANDRLDEGLVVELFAEIGVEFSLEGTE